MHVTGHLSPVSLSLVDIGSLWPCAVLGAQGVGLTAWSCGGSMLLAGTAVAQRSALDAHSSLDCSPVHAFCCVRLLSCCLLFDFLLEVYWIVLSSCFSLWNRRSTFDQLAGRGGLTVIFCLVFLTCNNGESLSFLSHTQFIINVT